MYARYFTLILGIGFVLSGIAGFIPGLVAPPHPQDPELLIDAAHGRLFGLLPVNILHNLVHLAFGVWGVLAWRRFPAARYFCRATAVIYGLLIVMGLIPGLNTTFGLIPIHGNDVWFHALIALPAAYFGFRAASPVDEPLVRDPSQPTGYVDR